MLSEFVELSPNIGIGPRPSETWVPMAALPVRILVGMTGAGKTTTVSEATRRHPGHVQVLPDRRVLTDHVILRRYAGDRPVKDRLERFELTRRFRGDVPGGMAAVLAELCLKFKDGRSNDMILFDGLRGIDEVGHAIRALPAARFLLLSAPIQVRLQRLLSRSDSFDVASFEHLSPETTLGQRLAEAGSGYLPLTVIRALQGDIEAGILSEDEVMAKISIVVAEATNYDLDATATILKANAPERSRTAETDRLSIPEVADLLEAM